MKNGAERAKNAAIYVIIGLIGVAALACIIISMLTDRVTPYLAMGLGLGCIGNAIGLVAVRRKKGSKDGSGKDGSIS